MIEDGSGKRHAPAPPVSGSVDSTPLPAASRATPTELLRHLVGSRPPMAVRFDEVGAQAQSAHVASDPALNELEAQPTARGFAPPEPPPRALTSVRPVFVPAADPSPPATAPENERGRIAPSDAPFAASWIEPPLHAFRPGGAVIAFVASLLVGALLVLLFRSSDGALMVTAGGVRDAPLASARVELDGKVVCENVPCRIERVPNGAHALRVQARGYRAPKERSVMVQSGAELVSHFTLEPEASASVDVRVDAPGLRIYVDGQDRGLAPRLVTGLAATGHLVELRDNSLFAPFEQRVELGAGDVTLIEPTLTLLRGAIVLRAGTGAKAASVYLERDGERRRVPVLPARVEVAPLRGYRVVATRRGFADFERAVDFSIARPEVDVLVELDREDGDAAALAGDQAADSFPDAASATPGASSLLTLESTPSSSIVLDGRPIGKTPQTLSVDAGAHSVVFFHPTLGRKSVSVRAKPGEPSSASVRF